MKLIVMSGHGLCFPMIKDGTNEAVCPTQKVAEELRVPSKVLRTIAYRNPDRFEEGLRTSQRVPKEFLREHQELFKIKRIREDIHFWNAREIMRFAILSRSKRAIEVQEVMIDMMLEDMKSQYVSREVFDKVIARLDRLELERETLQPYIDIQSSAAGKALQAKKGINQIMN